ncbi:MAG TPA: LPS export ABC transporter permease LptG [Thermoanaerobaculia bacterium]
MKILTRYILKEMTGPTVLGLIFYTSIILMQRLFQLAGLIIRRSLPVSTVAKLLLLSLPWIIVLTVPMSLLFGILIAIGRLSSDSEIIAMRALGISTRTIYLPVFLFSFAIFLINLYLMIVVLPRGNSELARLTSDLVTQSAAKEIKPRIFYDEFENLMIYVDDVDPHTGQWKGVFVADSRGEENEGTTPAQVVDAAHKPANPASAIGQRGGQRIIVARNGSIATVKATRQTWLNLHNAETHVWNPKKPDQYDLNRNALQRILLPEKVPGESSTRTSRSFREMTLTELLRQVKELRHSVDHETYNLARVEIQKKFAIPFACIVFGIVGLPLGITNRRGGKSSGFSLSIAIIVFYYVLINNGEQLAANGRISPIIGMWTADILLLGLGIYLLIRANRDIGAQRGDGGMFRRMRAAIAARKERRAEARESGTEGSSILSRLDITFPNILDRYILREFLKVLGLVMISTVVLMLIIQYTELSNDIREHKIPFHVVFAYFRYFMFQIFHWMLPISVLVATLVTFGMMSRNNEITAIKSGGVSLYRVALPILAVAAALSVLAYLLLDFVLPYSNQRMAQIEARIKGKKPIPVSAQQKLWLLGKGHYLLNFLSYDKETKTLAQVQVFEMHPAEFRLTRRVYAQRARWDGQGWVFENGWMASFTDDRQTTYTKITQPIRLYYAERPSDFETEVKSPEQMTFSQLHRYIETIRNAGYAPEEFSVKLYTKTSWPVLSMVMALIALPFAFRIGKRGALYGVGIALILGIVYWITFALFTKFGEVGNLPPALSAWSANILFAMAATYMFLHVET